MTLDEAIEYVDYLNESFQLDFYEDYQINDRDLVNIAELSVFLRDLKQKNV